uniref:Uncharacterized protein n=1 Tax=Branchiostoma floridae TaxID=7739 RepID=C3Y9A6_BRAFL|eukprot:XP_002607152.1 hypothetical protein BRAFLDRAFT_68054 [Branchiostoma floridae]
MMISRLRYRCSGCGYTTLQRKRIGDHVDGHRRDVERQAGQHDAGAERERVDSSVDQVRILIQIEEKEHRPRRPQQARRRRRCWTDDLFDIEVNEPEVGQQQKTSSDNSDCLPVERSVLPRGSYLPADENRSGKGQQALKIAPFNQLSNDRECVGQEVVRKQGAGKQPDELQKGEAVPRGAQTLTDQVQRLVGRKDTCRRRNIAVSNAHLCTNSGGDTTTVSDRNSAVRLPPLRGMVGSDSQRPIEVSALPLAPLPCAEMSSNPQQVILTTSPLIRMEDGTSLTSKTTTDREHCRRAEDCCTEMQGDGTPVVMDVFSLSDQATINKSQPDNFPGFYVTNTARRMSLSHLSLDGLESSNKAIPPQREIQSAPPALQTRGASLSLTPSPVCNLPVSNASENSEIAIQSKFLHQANHEISSDLHGMQKYVETRGDSQNALTNDGHHRTRDLRTKDQGSPENTDGLVYSNHSATDARVPVQEGVDLTVTSWKTLPFTSYGNVTCSAANAPGMSKFRTIAPKPSIDEIRPYYVGESRVFRCFQCQFMCLDKKLLLVHMREEQCYAGLVQRKSAMEALRMLKEGHTAKDTSQLQASNETCHGGTPTIMAEKSVPSPAANIEISSGDTTPEEDTNTVSSVAPVPTDNNNAETSGYVDSRAKYLERKKMDPLDDIIPVGTTFPKEVKFAAFKRPITIRNQHQADKLREILQHEHLKARFMHMLKVRLKRALTVVNEKRLGTTTTTKDTESNGDHKSQTVSKNANVKDANATTGLRCNTHAKASISPTLSPIPEVNIKKEQAEKFASCCSDEKKQDNQGVIPLPATQSKSMRSEVTSTTTKRQTKRMSPPNVPTARPAHQKGESMEEDDLVVYVGQDCEVQRGRTEPQIPAPGKLHTAVEALRKKFEVKEDTPSPTVDNKTQSVTPCNVLQVPQTPSPLSPSPLLQLTRLTHENPYLTSKPRDIVRVTEVATTEDYANQKQSIAMPCTAKNRGTASPDLRHATKRVSHNDPDVVECTPPKRQAVQQKNISFEDFQQLMRRHGDCRNVAMTTNEMYPPQTQGVDPRLPLRPLVSPACDTQNYSAAIGQNHSNTGQYPFQQQIGRFNDTADQPMAYTYCNGATDQDRHAQHLSRNWPPSRSPMNSTSPLDFHTDIGKHPGYRVGPIPPPLYNGAPRFNQPFTTHDTGDRYIQTNNHQDTGFKEDDISPEPMDLRVRKRRPSPPPLIRIEPSYHPRATVTSSAGPPITHNGWTRREQRFGFNGTPKSHMNPRERLDVILNEIETTVCSDYAAQMTSLS